MASLPSYDESWKDPTRCLICDQLITIHDNDNFHKLEVYRRFCTLVCRFLNFTCNGNIESNKSGHFKPRETLKTTKNDAQQLCDRCFHKAESFCEFYHNWTKLKLQLNDSIEEFAGLMKNTGQSEQNGMNMEFKEKFLKRVDRMVMNDKVYPELKLTRLTFIHDDDDNLFVPVVVRKVRMSKSTKFHGSTEFHQNDTNDTVAGPSTAANDTRKANNDNCEVSNTFKSLAKKIIKQTARKTANHQSQKSEQNIVDLEHQDQENQRQKETLPFRCHFCKKRFSTWQNRKVHQSRTHKLNILKTNSKTSSKETDKDFSSNTYSCRICSKIFSRNFNLQQHLRVHSGQRPYKCILQQCDKGFKLQGHLNKHIASLHNVGKEGATMLAAEWREIKKISATQIKRTTRTKQLGKCKKTEGQDHIQNQRSSILNSKYGMRERKPKPNNDHGHDTESTTTMDKENQGDSDVGSNDKRKNLQFKCTFCNKRFSTLRILKIHRTRMHKNLIFTRPKNVMNSDNEENVSSAKSKPFACTLCGKAFAFRLTLKIHERNHSNHENGRNDTLTENEETEESQSSNSHPSSHFEGNEHKQFACRVCEKRFKLKGNCQVHERIHTGLKPFKCDMCGKKFNQKCNLRQHLSGFHGLFDAEVKRLMAKESERITMERNNQMKSSSKTTTGTKALALSGSATGNNAKSENPYKCRFCNKRFRTIHSCRIHQGMMHQKPVLKNLKGFSNLKDVHPINKNTPKTPLQTAPADNDHNVVNINEAGRGKRSSQKVDFKLKNLPHKCRLCGQTWIQSAHLRKHLVKSHHFGNAAATILISKWRSKESNNTKNGASRQIQRGAITTTKNKKLTNSSRNTALANKTRTRTKIKKNLNHDKPFACRFCDARFKAKYNCQTHERIHTGERPYKCELCGTKRAQHHNLKTHLSFFHGLLDVEVKRLMARDSERRISERKHYLPTTKNKKETNRPSKINIEKGQTQSESEK